jgi:hypothetical protein
MGSILQLSCKSIDCPIYNIPPSIDAIHRTQLTRSLIKLFTPELTSISNNGGKEQDYRTSFIYLFFTKTIIPFALLNDFRSLLHYQLGTQQFVKD